MLLADDYFLFQSKNLLLKSQLAFLEQLLVVLPLFLDAGMHGSDKTSMLLIALLGHLLLQISLINDLPEGNYQISDHWMTINCGLVPARPHRTFLSYFESVFKHKGDLA